MVPNFTNIDSLILAQTGILDTGAIHNVCRDSSFFESFGTSIQASHVTLLTGQQATIV